ncbi:MAG: presenilin family intramembrane aspartyl protease [Candidatus Altiarchaeota archaeon]
MKYFISLTFLSSTYLLTLILGLNTAAFILPLMYPPEGQEQVIAPVVSNPESMGSSLQLFLYIIIGTAVMLILIKKKLNIIIQAAVGFSLLIGTLFTYSAIFGDLALLLTPLSLILAYLKRDTIVANNMLLTFGIAGIGSLLGASLGILPALALILIMSAYDLIAVFVTKHMVTLAKESQGKFTLMFTIPVGDRAIHLGAGDIAIPLTFSASVLAAKGAGYAIPTALGGLLGLIALFYYILGREKVTLPALPPITAGLIFGYALCLLTLG